MTTLFAPSALLPEGWADNVLIEVDREGWIVGVDSFKSAPAESDAETLSGPVIPGLCNVHSHAFQRAMAGLAERGSGKKDNFWSWRETMYRFLHAIDPDDMTAIATQAYVEMLKGGYTTVGEFHYVHHQPDGVPYSDRSTMSRHLIRSALDAGIAITHMPSLYAYGGFNKKSADDGQKRFLNKPADILRIIEECFGEFRTTPQVTIGFAPHSLRAVSPEMLKESVQAFRRLSPDGPIHIHAAEQVGEVNDCLETLKKRPVEWLLENAGVDDKWCLIHSTHVLDTEVRGIAASGAVVGLCPTTEANLGDGIFPLPKLFKVDGKFGIGSDSNVTVSAFDELRWLEYVQRLVYRERTIIHDPEIPSVAGTLLDRAARGGAQAVGRRTGKIEIGARADFLVLDDRHSFMEGKIRDHLLDAAVFAANENPIRHVMAGGRWVVRDRHHKREEQVLENFRRVMRKLS